MNPRTDRDWFPEPVRRFVDHVEAGQILKTTEFAGAVSVTVSNAFCDAGSCTFDSGAMTDLASRVVLLFHCKNGAKEQGIGAWLGWDGDRIRRVDVTVNDIVPGGAN